MQTQLLWRLILIVALFVLSLVFLIPTFLGYGTVTEEELRTGQQDKKEFIDLGITKLEPIKLGLDLQGGMHVVLGVQSKKAIHDELEHQGEVFRDRFKEEKIAYDTIDVTDKNVIEMVFASASDAQRGKTLIGDRNDYKVSLFGDTGIRMSMTERFISDLEKNAIRQAKETIERRVDEFNVREPQIYTQKDNISGVTQIVVRLPGIVDPKRAKKLIGRTAVLEFKLVERPEYRAVSREKLLEQIGGTIPDGYEIYEGVFEPGAGQFYYLLRKKADVPGKFLSDARVGYDDMGGFAVNFEFNSEGSKLFAKVTGANINKLLAIVLDDKVMSAPVIRTKISGNGQITGDYDHERALDLSIVLRSGSLPVPVAIEEERTVGPTLGKDSIEKGRFSLLIGGVAVLIFMALYYRRSGLIADLALVLNVVFILGALAAFGATLTLPGIAGIVLTIGMAVDANVIIFERIREEMRLKFNQMDNGGQNNAVGGKLANIKGVYESVVRTGYKKAAWTILDANITTAVAAIVLFQFGTGPIKGFAVTLSIGIITSVFTALIVTRMIYDLIFHYRSKMKKFSI